VGRASLGQEGRTVQAGLKVTKQEEQALAERFGSVGKGLRSLLDGWMLGRQARDPLVPRETGWRAPSELVYDTIPREQTAQEVDDLAVTRAVAEGKRHLHRRVELMRVDYVKGVRVEVWQCDCGRLM